MIGVDVNAARAIIADLSGLCDFNTLGSDAVSLCANLIETIADPHFPGALVPSIDRGGNLRILVVASTMSAWRQLRPVLQAFAGPTLTSFNGLPEALPQDDPAAGAVARSQPVSTGVMRLSSDPRNRLAALRALVRARDTFARAPNLQHSVPEPTSWLLTRFQDCLNVGRRDAAADVLARLRAELRLDALNLKFLEVQLLATFGDWSGIVDLPGFANLCLARRTAAVTALLLEAIYWVHLAGPFEAGDADETRVRFEVAARPLVQPMLRVPVPSMLTTAGWRVYGLEAWISTSRTDIGAALVGHLDALGWIADRLLLTAPDEEAAPAVQRTPIDDARDALVQVDAIDSVDALAFAVKALAKLNPEDLAQLREAEPFRSAFHVTEEIGGYWTYDLLESNGSKGRSTRRSPLLSTLRATARMNGRSNLEPETRRQFRHSCQRLKKLRATILPASGLYTRYRFLLHGSNAIQLSAGCHGADLRQSANPVRARLRPREWHLRIEPDIGQRRCCLLAWMSKPTEL